VVDLPAGAIFGSAKASEKKEGMINITKILNQRVSMVV